MQHTPGMLGRSVLRDVIVRLRTEATFRFFLGITSGLRKFAIHSSTEVKGFRIEVRADILQRDVTQILITMADFNSLNEAHVTDARATVAEAAKGFRSGDLPFVEGVRMIPTHRFRVPGALSSKRARNAAISFFGFR